jgi:small subunit ribosomal protein S19e
MSIYIVEPQELIENLAQKLKEFPEIKPPEGAIFWKTAYFKEVAPVDSENFWWVRCASLMRKIKKYGPIGVNRLRKHYGGRVKKGSGKAHSAKGAGKIIRVALQQLERADLIRQTAQDGRDLTPEGTSLLERTAYEITRNQSK